MTSRTSTSGSTSTCRPTATSRRSAASPSTPSAGSPSRATSFRDRGVEFTVVEVGEHSIRRLRIDLNPNGSASNARSAEKPRTLGHRRSGGTAVAAIRTLALVIRSVDVFETSRVLTLFTRELGKVSALAKGARRLKSPFQSGLDLLSVCDIVVLHKASDALDLLTEAVLAERFEAPSPRPAGPLRRLLHRRVARRPDRPPRPAPEALRRGPGDAPPPGRSRLAPEPGPPVRAGLPAGVGSDAGTRPLRPLRPRRRRPGATGSPSAWRPAASSAPTADPASRTSPRSRAGRSRRSATWPPPATPGDGSGATRDASARSGQTVGAVISHLIGRRPRLLPFV